MLIIHQLPFQTVSLGIGELIACRMMMSVCKLNKCVFQKSRAFKVISDAE